ncbi:cinnamoyl-CoA reductase CAD2-like [Bidens hawaiensis]|uniref:cinnamoyl-CoA reductase CAD2-like n=1 Tax=Bidens hawaiensis TaxID=980011 RepID=UPI004049BABC
MNACLKSKVNKVVVVSSILAVVVNPSWPKDQIVDENCWTDPEFCMKTEKWYCAGKAVSEREALEFGKKNNINVVSVCPSVVFGPILQSTLCTTNIILLNLFKGKNSFNLLEFDKPEEDIDIPIVDVRDCANALLLAYENPEAEGSLRVSNEKLNYTCEKLVNLGWNYRSLEKTLVDSVENMKESSLLS